MERVRLSDGNLAQVGDWIQARLNDQLITAGGQWLANRDILQITRIYGHGRDRQIEARRRLPDGTWTAKFTLPARYAEKSATLGYASTIYAAQGRTVDVAHRTGHPGHEPRSAVRGWRPGDAWRTGCTWSPAPNAASGRPRLRPCSRKP